MSRPTPRCTQCARPLAAVPVQAGQPAAAVDHDPAAPLHHGLAEAPQDLRAGAGPGAASSLQSTEPSSLKLRAGLDCGLPRKYQLPAVLCQRVE